ncbi:hypothetical protein SLEP1_g16544 [Rubroshorea leprosula]|uniref:Protein kinase domain-containing protein n=1 Tax=Rubroshorea leprosula TaxID=152421 RepID=A0AAV5J0H0_9ROSI|nr:hypothetical protein SLEP1_g16544 [Rubroshorea leprosula]
MAFLHALIWSLVSTASVGYASDIDCLKSVEDSLHDPHNSFKSSWNFNNKTEGFICGFRGVECWNVSTNQVLNIRLAHMGLEGQFPQGIRKCSSLTGLDLSGNKLSGPIPSDISNILPYVTSLDLSSNRFSGEIPKSIANCSFLNTLLLDNNQLTGHIPPQIGLLIRITTFSVANNLLYGPVPSFAGTNFSSDSFANNSGLCGSPLEPCNSSSDSFKSGFVVGYAVFSVSFVTIFISYCVPWWTQGKKRSEASLMQILLNQLLQRDSKRKEAQQMKKVPEIPHMDFLSEETKKASLLSYSEIKEATDNFNKENVIGFGRMGTTYKAVLPNGSLLAVKRLYDTPAFDEHFITELKTLGSLRHDNLVPLLGFCIQSKERLLVYKYMTKGSLYDWLLPEEGEARIMEWPLSVKIAIGVARGLVWLHDRCNSRIVHLDISSKCILLNENFEPKLSNFGEAILLKPNDTDSTESSPFANCEYWQSNFFKEDVYCFGIFLLELITGEDPKRMTTSSNSGNETPVLNEWVTVDFFCSFVNKSMMGQGFDQEIFQFLTVALDCVQPYPDPRPTMLQVYKTLGAVGKKHGLTIDSEILEHTRKTSAPRGDECNEDEITEV